MSDFPSWVPQQEVSVTLTQDDIWIIGELYNAASWESKASWDEETRALFAKLGVYKEPE